jgi:hypothetical protein
MTRWLKSGRICGRTSAVIDRAHPLEHVIEAHRYVDPQQKVGNVVLTVR